MPTPREAVAAECVRHGEREVVARCVTLIDGGGADDAFVMAISCGAARQVLEGREGGRTGYWPRVWGVRALLYAWDVTATPAVVRATGDANWRVREMAAKVIARRLVDEGLEGVARLGDDPVPRVRAAAGRTLLALTEANTSGQDFPTATMAGDGAPVGRPVAHRSETEDARPKT